MLARLQPSKQVPAMRSSVWSSMLKVTRLMVQARISETPKPIRVLNRGPAKHAVIAVCCMPSLAIAGFAQKSPAELPQASMVSPRMLIGRFRRIPRRESRSTITSQILQIHRIDITNDKIVSLLL